MWVRRRQGGRCASASLGEAEARPTLLGEADACPASTGRRMRVQHRRGGGRCMSDGSWERRRGRVEASGAAQCQRAGEQSVASQGWWATASSARPALGFHGGGSASVGNERMDLIPIRSRGRATVGSQWDPHVRHGQRDGNGVGGLHRCDFRIRRVKLSTLTKNEQGLN
jgi:hypothetical protein